jgi:trans-aconitate 3-methyltransferase
MYDNLAMPWDVKPPVIVFPREGFTRYEWNRNGALEEGEVDFFGGNEEVTLDELRDSLGTASMVTRWREVNGHIANTEQDCVEVTMRAVAQALGLSKSDIGRQTLKIGSATTLLMLIRAENNSKTA